MALIEREKKAELAPLRIKLEKEHHDRLVRYAEFLESSPDHIIAPAVDFVIRRDKEFAARETSILAPQLAPTWAKKPQTRGENREPRRHRDTVRLDRGSGTLPSLPVSRSRTHRMVHGQGRLAVLHAPVFLAAHDVPDRGAAVLASALRRSCSQRRPLEQRRRCGKVAANEGRSCGYSS